MPDLLFSPATQAIVGGLGAVFSLWSIQRRRDGKPSHPDAAKADKLLLVFSALMVMVGLWRWVMSPVSAVAG